MNLKRLHRLRNSEPDESGTDTLEDVAPEDEKDIDPENPDGEEQKEEEQTEVAEEELIVTIGDEPPSDEEESRAPNWVKDLRKKNREDQKRIRELEEKLAAGTAPKSDDPGKEPELEDFDYDADQFKAAFKDWTAKKAKAEQQKEIIRAQQEESAKEWAAVQETYAKGKARFPKDKMQEAEDEVVSVLPGPRQAMLMDMADDSAALVLALHSNPDVLRKLAGIKSDAKFVKELAKVEMQVKVQTKGKTPPPPERTVSGSGRSPGASAANLDKIRADAEKSGDYSKYFAEKRRLGK